MDDSSANISFSFQVYGSETASCIIFTLFCFRTTAKKSGYLSAKICAFAVLLGTATKTTGGGNCVFPFTYNSKPRVTCIFNDSNFDKDGDNAMDGAVLTRREGFNNTPRPAFGV